MGPRWAGERRQAPPPRPLSPCCCPLRAAAGLTSAAAAHCRHHCLPLPARSPLAAAGRHPPWSCGACGGGRRGVAAWGTRLPDRSLPNGGRGGGGARGQGGSRMGGNDAHGWQSQIAAGHIATPPLPPPLSPAPPPAGLSASLRLREVASPPPPPAPPHTQPPLPPRCSLRPESASAKLRRPRNTTNGDGEAPAAANSAGAPPASASVARPPLISSTGVPAPAAAAGVALLQAWQSAAEARCFAAAARWRWAVRPNGLRGPAVVATTLAGSSSSGPRALAVAGAGGV